VDKSKSIAKIKKDKISTSGSWDTAIADAEELIQKATGDIRKLKKSIRYFRQQIQQGRPFPGQESSAVKQD
jgi:hypothetical protein